MIRLACQQDIPRLLAIYDAARKFMRQNGNDVQWGNNYPAESVLCADIAAERLYAIEEDGQVCACFMLAAGPDDTYDKIFDGAWASDTPYGVIHRVASDGTQKGIVARCVAFARQRYCHLRIDTHEKNLPMQRALIKAGFTRRGTIIIGDGTPRFAYDWVK